MDNVGKLVYFASVFIGPEEKYISNKMAESVIGASQEIKTETGIIKLNKSTYNFTGTPFTYENGGKIGVNHANAILSNLNVQNGAFLSGHITLSAGRTSNFNLSYVGTSSVMAIAPGVWDTDTNRKFARYGPASVKWSQSSSSITIWDFDPILITSYNAFTTLGIGCYGRHENGVFRATFNTYGAIYLWNFKFDD